MVHFGEWTTGFLGKGRIPAFAPKYRELVVHFQEWTTSFLEKGRNRANAPKKRELVVHFQEWATSFQEKGSNQANAPKRQELVVHFQEWTTSSGGIYLFKWPAPCSLFPKYKRSPALEWQGCLLLTGLFSVLGVGDPDAGYD